MQVQTGINVSIQKSIHTVEIISYNYIQFSYQIPRLLVLLSFITDYSCTSLFRLFPRNNQIGRNTVLKYRVKTATIHTMFQNTISRLNKYQIVSHWFYSDKIELQNKLKIDILFTIHLIYRLNILRYASINFPNILQNCINKNITVTSNCKLIVQ